MKIQNKERRKQKLSISSDSAEQTIRLTLEEAKLEKEKNAKMYKTLGLVIGITIVIILA